MQALEEEAWQKAEAEQAKRRAEAERQGRTYRPRKDPQQVRPSPKVQRYFTYPNSRIMKGADGRFIQGYSAQAAVDTETPIILTADLTNQAADAPHLSLSCPGESAGMPSSAVASEASGRCARHAPPKYL